MIGGDAENRWDLEAAMARIKDASERVMLVRQSLERQARIVAPSVLAIRTCIKSLQTVETILSNK